MWNNIIYWLLQIVKSIGDFASFLFTPLGELQKVPLTIFGQTTSFNLNFWVDLFPNLKVIDLISVTGLTIVFVILLFKKIDVFS